MSSVGWKAAAVVGLLCISQFAVAEFQPGGISPITENPIPSWASSSDDCSSVSSCDSCQLTDSQYCRWTEASVVSCCKNASEKSEKGEVVIVTPSSEDDSGMFGLFKSFMNGLWGDSSNQQPTEHKQASVTPIQETEPESASVTPIQNSADPESAAVTPQQTPSEPESAAITPIQQQAEPESAAVTPLKDAAEPESAAILPISENPIPEWATEQDSCSEAASCDDCHLKGYCKYSSTGKPSCCVKSTERQQLKESVKSTESKLVASISPIVENPVPASASSADSCSRKRSCDLCSEQQYCKYTDKRVPQCCTLASKTGTETEKASVEPVQPTEPESISVTPIKNSAQPESASVTPIQSKAEPESAAVTPIKSAAEPESAAVLPIQNESEPESASIGPITNQIPQWASSSDVCLEMACDECVAHQYCQFTKEGKQQCCGKITLTL